MTDFKQLCAELVDDLEMADWPWKLKELFRADIQRARAALAEPEQEGPTTRQLMMLADDMEMASVGDAAEYARAVLARWGNHLGTPDSSTPQPVPVSERLPGPGDCDAEGRCWWYGEGGDMTGWTIDDLGGLSYYRATHWLPAHALSRPNTEPTCPLQPSSAANLISIGGTPSKTAMWNATQNPAQD